MGPRGDVIVELDWSVGQIMAVLDRLGLARDTLFIFSSDNGPVLDDGYRDQAVELVGDHRPAGPWRGGKGSIYDGGTRVPFVVRWPGKVKPGVSSALIGQVDMIASLTDFTGQKLPPEAAPDSFDVLPALLGKSRQGRDHLIEHAGTIALIAGGWKLIQPRPGGPTVTGGSVETGNQPEPQLFNVAEDPAEQHNVAAQYPEKVSEMMARLEQIEKSGRSRSQ
jgi:arylsulfatase A-like enzyme